MSVLRPEVTHERLFGTVKAAKRACRTNEPTNETRITKIVDYYDNRIMATSRTWYQSKLTQQLNTSSFERTIDDQKSKEWRQLVLLKHNAWNGIVVVQ
jgi:hypothetical protein